VQHPRKRKSTDHAVATIKFWEESEVFEKEEDMNDCQEKTDERPT